jgi:flagellar hook-associated protein 2
MESVAAISGLATGIEFRDIVDQIIEIESSRLNYLRVQITDGQAEKTAWEEVRGLLEAIEAASETLADGSGLDVFTTSVLGLNPAILGVSTSEDASPGRHTVRVFQTAEREVLGSSLQASRSSAIGVAGQFIVGGTAIDVVAEDSLQSIAGRINAQNFGANPIGVSASVVGTEGAYRLVLSASETGAQGLGLLDTGGLLTSLGFFDGTTQLKNRSSGGFDSDAFSTSTDTIASQLGFSGAAPAGTVTLGGGAFTVALDLGTQSLEDIRDAINAAAAGAGSAMFATIEADPESGYRLSVTGTAAATDAGGVLQALGVLEGGRGAVTQVVQGDVLTTDAGGTPATAATALTSLFNGGSSAAAAVGDTIVFEGTDGSGTAFTFTQTIQAGDTLQTLLTRLEGAEGFNGSATAAISVDGRLTITSTTPGSSLLSLNGLAGNEGGGILDLGDFVVTAEGRDRQVSEGRDAIVEIDGALVTSASNDIADVVAGVTFTVLGADPANPLEVVIGRDEEAGVEAVTAFVDAVNALATLVDAGAGLIGDARPPLAGDSILRGIRDRINFAMQVSVPVGPSGSIRLSDLGIEITREGTYSLDTVALTTALQEDSEAVRRAFGSFGSGSTAALTYLGAGTATQPGTYDVSVSQAATRASVTSAGFGGVYVDDGTADTLTITDVASSAQYQVALANGMTLTQIIDAANTAFDQQTAQEITSERTMYSDSGATTVATDATVLSNLYFGAGQNSGFVAGTELTFSGTDRAGSSVLQTFTVTDPATQTLGTLRTALQSAFGSGVSASVVNGQLVVTDTSAGASQLSVNVGSDVPGNAAPFGQMLVSTQGQSSAGLVAEDTGGELTIRGASFGSAQNFSVAFTAGGTSGIGSLGLTAGTYSGLDVIGTIGGEAATGVGGLLTADSGTTADGLRVQVTGSGTGSIGQVTFGRGIMATVQEIAEELLGTDDGSLDGIVKRLTEGMDRAEDRLFDREARLEDRRARLIARFVSLEVAISRSQSQQQWLQAQISSLPSNGG